MKAATLIALFALALAEIGCRKDAPDPAQQAAAAGSGAIAAPSETTAPRVTRGPGAEASAEPCTESGPRACRLPAPEPGRYTPIANEEAAQGKSAGDSEGNEGKPSGDGGQAAKEAPQPSEAKRPLGSIDDWVRAYDGSGAPETKKPPRLGVLADVPSLPKSTLVYVRSGRLVRADLPSGTEVHLAAGRFSSVQPRFTRDGRAIFFLSNKDGGVEKIFRMSAEGADIRPVTRGLRADVFFEWEVSDDGSRVAYIRDASDGIHELHVVRTESGDDEVVHRGVMLSYPSFSRDGKTLFFTEGWLTAPGNHAEDTKKIASIDLATGAKKSLPNAGVAEITAPWDLGDGRLLFAASGDFSMAGREPRLHTMPLGGGAWSTVGDFRVPIGYVHAKATLDRKKLALGWSMRQGGFGADWDADVSVMPLTGGPARRLTSDFPRPFYGASSPAWAPDGRHLAFVLNLCPYVGCEINIRSVVVVDTDATNPKLAFVGYGGSPVFSPVSP